jgi:CRISPR-associated protein Csn2
MKLAYSEFSNTIFLGGDKISSLVIENKKMFRNLLCDLSSALEGNDTNLVLSENDKIIDVSKHVELLCDFINFDINKKPLINKIISELEKKAVSAEQYVKTQELLLEICKTVDEWAFSFPCNVILSKISVSTLLKSVGIEIQNEYEGHIGEVEKIFDYMELVREFDKDKLFITVNMRSFFEDDIIQEFIRTVVSHEFNLLMIESQAYQLLEFEKRLTIDADLCEF